MPEDVRLRKLTWLCRRGMKELDVLLERFISQQRTALADGQWPEFETLLANEDDRIWDWVQNPQHADAAQFHGLLSCIRDGSGTST